MDIQIDLPLNLQSRIELMRIDAPETNELVALDGLRWIFACASRCPKTDRIYFRRLNPEAGSLTQSFTMSDLEAYTIAF